MVIEMDWALAWLAATSLTALVATVWDKQSARRHGERVPERTLFLIAALGGALVMWLTMGLVRHKTLHRRFMLGLPAIVVLQATAVVLLYATEFLQFI